MKFLGNLAFSSSFVLKYFMTCEYCFQKFSISCADAKVVSSCVVFDLHRLHKLLTYLKLRMALL